MVVVTIFRYGYGSIPINTIFSGMKHPFTSYFDVHQGYKVLTHCHISEPWAGLMLLWVASVKAVDFAYFLPGDFKGFSVQHLGYLEWSPMTNIVQVEIHQPSATTSFVLTLRRLPRHFLLTAAVGAALSHPWCSVQHAARGADRSGGIHHGMLDTKGPPHDLRPSRIGHVPWNLEFVHRCWSGSETYLRDIWWYRISKLHPLQHYFEVNTGVNGLRQPQLWSPADIVLLTKPRNTRRHVAVCDVAVPRMADSADESGSSNWGGFRGPLSDSLGNGHSKRIQFLPEIGWSEVYTILYH